MTGSPGSSPSETSPTLAHRILIVDDEKDIRSLLSDVLSDEGFMPFVAADGAGCIEALKTRKPDLVILDIWLNDSRFDGIELLDVIRKDYPSTPVIMISGHANVETAVRTLKKGAYDFIEKPFTTERLLLIVRHALEASTLRRQNQELHGRLRTLEPMRLIGISSAISSLKSNISKLATTNSRIILQGPPGVGKETVARHLHFLSRRAQAPFIVIDCRSPQLEDILLGHEPADARDPLSPIQVGALEQAHTGTLLLQNVEEVSLPLQTKLAKIFHELKFARAGGTQGSFEKKISVDVRLIGTTSVDLAWLVKQGKLREDFLFRLGVVTLKIPGLNERPEDILPLFEFFASGLQFSADAQDALSKYTWPGNVHQLRNMAEWLKIAKGSEGGLVTASDLPPEIGQNGPSVLALEGGQELLQIPLRQAREVFERQYLASQIIRFGGNISRTAEFIEMERSALHRKLRSLGIGSDGRPLPTEEDESPEEEALAG